MTVTLSIKYINPKDSVLCRLGRMRAACQSAAGEWQEMTAGCDYLLLSQTRPRLQTCQPVAFGGIWWYSYTCSHVSEGIKTYVTLMSFSGRCHKRPRRKWRRCLSTACCISHSGLYHYSLCVPTHPYRNISSAVSSPPVTQFGCSLF